MDVALEQADVRMRGQSGGCQRRSSPTPGERALMREDGAKAPAVQGPHTSAGEESVPDPNHIPGCPGGTGKGKSSPLSSPDATSGTGPAGVGPLCAGCRVGVSPLQNPTPDSRLWRR